MRYIFKDKATGELEVPNRKPLEGEWCLDTKTGTSRQYTDGMEAVVVPASSNKVPWSTFESELPDSVITELNSIRNRTLAAPKQVIKAVIELTNDMNSDKKFDVFGSEIITLLVKMVTTNLITLDQATADTILITLQGN